MFIVNICGQKLASCKFCKKLDVQQYKRLAWANASLALCSLFYMYFVPKLLVLSLFVSETFVLCELGCVFVCFHC